MQTYDVVVIGAGPAGSMAGRVLAERGRNVLLLEKGEFPGRKKACGGMLPLNAFREFDIPERIIETETEQEIFVFPWYKRTTKQRNAVVQRTVFDEELTFLARGAGANLIMSSRVSGVERQRDGKMSIEATSSGERRRFQSAAVIFADGVHTMAAPSMGIGFRKRRNNVAFGLEYALEAPDNKLRDYHIFFGETEIGWGYIWVFPNKNFLNVGVYLLPWKLRKHPGRRDILNYKLNTCSEELAELLRGKRVVKRIGGFIPMEPASSLHCESAVVAGDSAGLVFPFTAGGIKTALLSGKLAGEIVDDALSGRQPLASYEARIKASPYYKTMLKESLLFKASGLLMRIDKMIYPKLFCLWKLRSEFSAGSILKTVCYPLLGGFDQEV